MKALLCTLILATLGTAAAKADEVTITLDQPTQSASAGDTLQFFGTITNDTNQTIYLNSDDPTLNGVSFAITDDFTNTPVSLAPEGQAGDSSTDIELFDVAVSDPLADAAGVYSGAYTLIGGADGNAQDNLGTATFSVTTLAATPEPPSLYLLLTSMLAVAGLAWKGIRPRIA